LIWAKIHQHPKLYRHATRLAAVFRGLTPYIPSPWRKSRNMPKPAKMSLHQQVKGRPNIKNKAEK